METRLIHFLFLFCHISKVHFIYDFYCILSPDLIESEVHNEQKETSDLFFKLLKCHFCKQKSPQASETCRNMRPMWSTCVLAPQLPTSCSSTGQNCSIVAHLHNYSSWASHFQLPPQNNNNVIVAISVHGMCETSTVPQSVCSFTTVNMENWD